MLEGSMPRWGRFSSRSSFYQVESISSFDIILAFGLLHNLDDESVMAVVKMVRKALKSRWCLTTADHCQDPSKNMIAHFLVKNKRGQYVQIREEYEVQARAIFESLHTDIRNKSGNPLHVMFYGVQIKLIPFNRHTTNNLA